MSVTEAFEELRPLMFSIAYRMLGSVADAEDIVQEAFLRYHRALADGSKIESPRAFLSSVTTRLSIDQLRSARSRREAYVGPWLPEPVLNAPVLSEPAVTTSGGSSPASASRSASWASRCAAPTSTGSRAPCSTTPAGC